MKNDSLRAGIEHRIAELRAAHPRISDCHATLESWQEAAAPRYSLRIEIRWPQHQSLISGPACAGAEQAVEAAFDVAARSLTSHA
jgi:hypothetical protein